MLSINKRVAQKHGKYQQCALGGDGVFCILENFHDCAPATRVKTPTTLLRPEDWMKASKTYRLSNKSMQRLKKFWALGETHFRSDNVRETFAFQHLEDLMVQRMKRFHKGKAGVQYLPFHEWRPGNESVNNHLIMSNSSGGKSYFCNQLLTTLDAEGKNYAQNRPIVAFTNNVDDPSLAPARKMHKKNWLDVDLTKLDGRLSIDMLKPGSLVLFDDVLETNDHRSSVLFDLLNTIVTVGRHKKAARGRPIECIVLTHNGSNFRLKTCRQSCRWWTLFPGQRQQCVHLLKHRLNWGKTQIEQLLKRCAGSRTVSFQMWYPQLAVSKHHVELL
jgi:hypothetical protein